MLFRSGGDNAKRGTCAGVVDKTTPGVTDSADAKILEVAAMSLSGDSAKNDKGDKDYRKVELATVEEQSSVGESPRAPPA